MDRKDFIRKGLMGTGFFVSSAAIGETLINDIDELKQLDLIGFNHIPNAETNRTNNTVLHKSDTRGDANHGWLQSRHSFSFANYYNPDRMHFGVLRVLNDDIVARVWALVPTPTIIWRLFPFLWKAIWNIKTVWEMLLLSKKGKYK